MPHDLLKRCIAARDSGADFPTIYDTIIRRADRLGPGLPTHRTDGRETWLQVRLVTGHCLIYQSGTNEYRLV